MSVIASIKHALGLDAEAQAETPSKPEKIPQTPEDTYLGTQYSATGVVPEVSTHATDPALHDVAAAGVQPVSKPTEIEREQNPEARRENDVVRTK